MQGQDCQRLHPCGSHKVAIGCQLLARKVLVLCMHPKCSGMIPSCIKNSDRSVFDNALNSGCAKRRMQKWYHLKGMLKLRTWQTRADKGNSQHCPWKTGTTAGLQQNHTVANQEKPSCCRRGFDDAAVYSVGVRRLRACHVCRGGSACGHRRLYKHASCTDAATGTFGQRNQNGRNAHTRKTATAIRST